MSITFSLLWDCELHKWQNITSVEEEIYDYHLLQGYQSEASKVMALVEDISALLGGNHTVRRPSSGPILHGSPALVPPQITASNNNFTREESTDGIEETGTGLGMPPPSNRSQSFPRSVTPIYPHHHMVTNSPRQPFHHHVRSTAGDLGTSEEHVLITAFDPSSRPQISMIPSEEANNNNPPSVEMRVNNSNSYYMGEVPPPPLHQVHHQPQRALLHNTAQTRQHLRWVPVWQHLAYSMKLIFLNLII
ncbi:hypothetical protein E2C01_075284 [Portunus trituberculatus]|uniref:Uncharacterized protein n=1 Tax=Portunus trituberculatus TaxID=210409 RepID=A0A5B7IFG3_PORTR|nr:hypothetical protein [Portunus trituberculatus]